MKIKFFTMPNHSSGGYIAITSAMIIFGFVVALALAAGLGAFLTRATIAGSYYKDISRALADACADTALLKLSGNVNYAGGETVSVGSDACDIISVTTDGGEKVISVKGAFQGAVTNVVIRANASNLSIAEWKEVKSL